MKTERISAACVEPEFVRRGLASIAEIKRSGCSISAEVVIGKLEAKLAAARILQAQVIERVIIGAVRHQLEDGNH
jgi:hypothetical protein